MSSKKRTSTSAADDDDADFFDPSDADSENAATKPPARKRARKSAAGAADTDSDITRILALTSGELQKCEHGELVAYVEALQRAVRDGSSGKAAAAAAPVVVTSGVPDDRLAGEVEKTREIMVKAIKKSMTWKPSCKSGPGAKFSYSAVLTDDRVLPLMLGMKATDRFKAKRMTQEEFQDKVGQIEGSVRYATLYLKGNVNIKWDHDGRMFSVSGSYGK